MRKKSLINSSLGRREFETVTLTKPKPELLERRAVFEDSMWTMLKFFFSLCLGGNSSLYPNRRNG